MTTANTSQSLPSVGVPKPFHPLPVIGDIVLCRFPYLPGVPGPKERPALVVRVSPTTHEIMVCFGTSQKTQTLYPGEFLIASSDPGFSVSGLDRSTKFDTSRRAQLPFNDEWFMAAPGLSPQSPSPKLGIMHPCYSQIAVAAAQAKPPTQIPSVVAKARSRTP